MEVDQASENVKQTEELYAYTKRQEFTSESFKIEVRGLPKYYGLGEFKKLLQKTLHLNPHKLKPLGPKSTAIFIAFKNENDRLEGISKLNGFKWKKNELSAFVRSLSILRNTRVSSWPFLCSQKSSAAPDPYVKKTLQSGQFASFTEDEAKSAIEKQTIPLFAESDDEQCSKKRQAVCAVVKNLGKQLLKVNEPLTSWILEQKKLHGGIFCDVDPCLASPVKDGYRNKCEFTIGPDIVTKEPSVGFRLSSYKAGSIGVAQIGHLAQVSDLMKKIVSVCNEKIHYSFKSNYEELIFISQHFDIFVKKSPYLPYNPVDHSGYWRTLMLRTTRNGDAMACIGLHRQQLDPVEMDQLKADVIKCLTDPALESCVKSIYLKDEGRRNIDRENGNARQNPASDVTHIFGEEYVAETIRGLKFRISPKSFFQCNTYGAEVLYDTILKVADLRPTESYVFDVCCGTGTIGLCAADSCVKVVGVDIVPEAIEDAKHNAEVNDLAAKVDFIAGSAEELICGLLKKLNIYGAGENGSKNIVAIVDPPRAGLHRKVISVLRREKDIGKIVYVSCDPKSATQNFIDLGREWSGNYPGEPFLPTKIVPIDLYPYTEHVEVVILFERASACVKILELPVEDSSEKADPSSS
ncbi:unnamed protein product [Notodromas monacha]|uniref:tRNA (uracil(54)-C(5))-methyltransferase n=1 Tax=Notodromas monacha TaxID=399045 RepID=A0A7R9BK90_9CRUS|nr:unnamed protein product [Notodromas monacha]CAG0917035.1 unnamed protein product [Notodromas monacha]